MPSEFDTREWTDGVTTIEVCREFGTERNHTGETLTYERCVTICGRTTALADADWPLFSDLDLQRLSPQLIGRAIRSPKRDAGRELFFECAGAVHVDSRSIIDVLWPEGEKVLALMNARIKPFAASATIDVSTPLRERGSFWD